MTSVKISALTAASTLVGTETVPVVQNGVTVRAQVNDLLTYANINISQTVATLAALKALTTRPEAVIVETGQAKGVWQWELASTTTADDALVVTPTSGTAGRYKRVYSGSVYVDWFGAVGDNATNDSAAFTAALSAAIEVICTTDKIYRVKDISMNGRRLVLNGAVIEPYTGAKYALRLTGFYPQVTGGTIRDSDSICAKSTTLSGGALLGATTISVTSATGFEVGQWVGVMQDTGYPHGALITGVSGTTITLQRGLLAAAASGQQVVASWGTVSIYDSRNYLVQDLLFVNTACGIWNDRGSGTENTYGALSNVSMSGIQYFGLAYGRDTGAEDRTNVRLHGGTTRTQTATGNGVTTDYDTDRNVFLTRDLTVTVNGVTKTLTTDYVFVDTNTIRFNSAPANGAAISYSNFYDGWFGNFVDESGWATVRGGDQWANCETLDFFYGSYFADKVNVNFVNCIDDTNQTNLYLTACDRFLYSGYFNGFASRTISVQGSSVHIVFGGPLYTKNVPAASTVAGSVVGNIDIGASSEIMINGSGWSAESDKTITGSGTVTTPQFISSVSATPALTITNNADTSGPTVAYFDGDRATPADFDGAGVALRLSDTSGTQREFGRLGWFAQDADVATGLDGGVLFSAMVASVLTALLRIEGGFVRPSSNDGLALGSGTLAFSDLFLASGGVINWNNGTYTLTQAGTVLTANGSIVATALTASGNINTTAGTVNFLGATTGLADVMAITASPAVTAYTTGATYSVKANLANATTTPTININGLGAKTLVKRVSTALAANDYLANMFIQLQYDGTNMVLLNPVVN